ncbi:hypothetical protein [Ulvibacterium sp.]|uniref:hypothetical protein n=1 Tax=Ulvibacterium sp. TaxID=2665914 RepID=UPI00261A5979|nr:hypothetical protein [Ulvibacterium sp.]
MNDKSPLFLVFIFILGTLSSYSQDAFSVAYSSKGWSNGSAGRTFQRGVLILNRDSTFLERREMYLDKRFFKKSIPFVVEENYGSYRVMGDTLILQSEKEPNHVPDKFVVKNNRKIYFFHDGLEITSPKSWKKILSPKFGDLKIK